MNSNINPAKKNYSVLLYGTGLTLVVVAAIAASYWLISNVPLSIDEATHLVWTKLMAAGYSPYSQVYMPAPPLWPMLLLGVWKIWSTITALETFMVAIWAAGILSAALICLELTKSPKASVFAALLLAFSVLYFESSQAIFMDITSIVAAMVAIWAALKYQRSGSKTALVVSALFTAASLESKILLPFLPILVAGIVLSKEVDSVPQLRNPLQPHIWKPLLIWGIAFLILPVLSLIIFDPQNMYNQVIGQRLEARASYLVEQEPYWEPRLKRLANYTSTQQGLLILAGFGLILAFAKKLRGRWLLLAWLLFSLLMLAIHTPIRTKHFLLLSPPLAVLGGYLFLSNILLSKKVRYGVVVVAIVGLVLFFADFYRQIPVWQSWNREPDPSPRHLPALQLISEITTPADCIASDYAQLLVWTDRLPPPELAEVTSNRLKSGFLTSKELVEISQQHNCQVVAPLTGRFHKWSESYLEWVKQNYYGKFIYNDESSVIYFAKPVDSNFVQNYTTPYNIKFGQVETNTPKVQLTGVSPLPQEIRAGQSIPISLFWLWEQPPETDYSVFVQLRNSENSTAAGADHQPYKGLLPFTQWPTNNIMADTAWLEVPADIPAGDYNIMIGLYNPGSLQRMSVFSDQSGENAVNLGAITVKP